MNKLTAENNTSPQKKSTDTNCFWQGFWQLADPKIWVASTVPMLIGVGLVISNQIPFSFLWFLIALVAIYLIEIGKNAVNEAVDFRSGVDLHVTDKHKTDFSGGKKNAR
ncbi:MAG: hypothetical protein LRY73_00025 [Bacillus sp. (in: Bacteria)]|nr:hypothetical protein [Bacillus sp. (in: firmicutes)]